MKWLSTKYAYPPVIIAIAISIALQVVWLSKFFGEQRVQVKLLLEQAVSNAAKNTAYTSFIPAAQRGGAAREFFLSSDWHKLKMAYDNLQTYYIQSHFHNDIVGDSTVIEIRLAFKNLDILPPQGQRHIIEIFENIPHVNYYEQFDLNKMDSTVRAELRKADITAGYYYLLYNYEDSDPSNPGNAKPLNQADYYSQKYAFNLNFLHKYQLIVPHIDGIVLFRMRYYLVSSLFMVILIGAVFYFILRLMRDQRLYANARIAFTSNMTHELKTPVATVGVALESITKYHLLDNPEKMNQYLAISQNELKRLNLMIEKVLNLEQLDNGEEHLRNELFDVQQGLREVVNSMQLQIDNSHARISVELSEEPCFVNGDPTHLTNVFYNLIDNALKYSGEKIFLKVKCTCDNEYIQIRFEDNGPGIDRIYHNRIFDRFFRVTDNNDVHNVNGSGLGLNYVKQIIEKHGGTIKVISELGQGSKFIINLPVAK
jgi:signal transduction histidine kinase